MQPCRPWSESGHKHLTVPPPLCRHSSYVSAPQTTQASGIRTLVPDAVIDDYVFEPCGYSMNGQEGSTFSTVHITPEAGFSYASFEISCFEAGSVNVQEIVTKLATIFRPGEFLFWGCKRFLHVLACRSLLLI